MGRATYPQYSLDLTPCDFCLFTYVKKISDRKGIGQPGGVSWNNRPHFGKYCKSNTRAGISRLDRSPCQIYFNQWRVCRVNTLFLLEQNFLRHLQSGAAHECVEHFVFRWYGILYSENKVSNLFGEIWYNFETFSESIQFNPIQSNQIKLNWIEFWEWWGWRWW
jgi:hypothetical protein